ncbi:LPS export ABC transporter periplasmic protein LptC [Chitinophaga horti]|uniref:LPS export ABC transporter periplasmic protein LptC n=1 Tax=Chitinophaga horti TaxID=2920382 RepID=A0ABY6J2Y7_9BACT|nr:LPS export ABC transporter periplasmic protein LptC [Chitinophaga horti]UYQ92559.1 LPS export ABC transporter periplasmic protein LptC [Chitinophaga horti]
MKKFLLYTTLAMALYSCENKLEAVRALDKSAVGVEEGFDIRVIISQGGHVKAELTGPYMERHLQHPAFVEFSKGLKARFYNDSMVQTSTLTAFYGKYFESNGDLFLRDSVVLINILTNERMDCHRLKYDALTQRFSSDTAVRYVSNSGVTYGTGFESNSDFSDISFIKGTAKLLYEDSAVTDSTGEATDSIPN